MFAHPGEMRALPVDIAARAALQKAGIVLPASLGNAAFDSGGVNFMQQAVAAQAAGEGPDTSRQIEPDHDFQNLLVRRGRKPPLSAAGYLRTC